MAVAVLRLLLGRARPGRAVACRLVVMQRERGGGTQPVRRGDDAVIADRPFGHPAWTVWGSSPGRSQKRPSSEFAGRAAPLKPSSAPALGFLGSASAHSTATP